MLGLLTSTILTSAADSLNPLAITQQFVLQGMVKKPKHIWYYIIPTGMTNMVGGFLAYFGLAALIGNFFSSIMETHARLLSILLGVLGMALLAGAVFFILKRRMQKTDETEEADAAQAAKKIRSVSPPALIALGVGATISELTTALPYFAFLAILLNHQLPFYQVALVLVLYNTIYTLPLMVLYVVYAKAREKFDRLYEVIRGFVAKWAGILAPILLGGIGGYLLYSSVSSFL